MVWRATPVDFSRILEPNLLKGKSILITGGTDGIGLDIAKVTAEHGAFVTITGRSNDRGQQSEAALTSLGYKVQFIQSDVASWESQLRAFKAAKAFSPRSSLDIVIANAGVGSHSILDHAFPASMGEDEDPPAPSTTTFDVNVTGAYYTTVLALHFFKKSSQKAADATMKKEKKQLLFMGSMMGYTFMPLSTDYVTSKFALRAIFKSIRFSEDALGLKFRTNLVAPAYIRTSLTAARVDQLEKSGMPVGKVEEVTDTVVRILVDESIDGRALAVTKGETWDLLDDPAGGDASQTIYRPEKLEKVGGAQGGAIARFDEYFK